MPTKFIPISGFKGGLAASLFDPVEKQTYQSAKDLDVFSYLNILKPVFPKLVNVTPPSQPDGATNINLRNFFKASDGGFYFLGTATIGGSNRIIVWRANNLGSNPSWSVDYNTGLGGTNPYYAMTEYEGGLIFGDNSKLQSMNLSTKAVTTLGMLTDSAHRYEDIIYHRGLKKLFFVYGPFGSGNRIGFYDGTFQENKLIIDSAYRITNLEEHGRWVLIGLRHKGNSQRSIILVWDGSSTTIDDIIEIGDVGLQGFRNKSGVLYAHLIVAREAPPPYNVENRLYKILIGGRPSLEIVLFGGGSSINPNAISLTNNRFYTVLDGEEVFNAGIYSIHSGDKGVAEFVTKIRYPSVGTSHAFKAIKDTGSELVVLTTDNTSGTVERIFGSGVVDSQEMPSTGVYESNAIALNGGLPATLKKIYINHKPIPANCGFTVAVKYYGHYPFDGTVPSEDSYTNLTTSQGSGSTTGKTQSTNNATYTEIPIVNPKKARYAQIKISFDEVSGTNAPEIVFPILLEVEI